MLLSSPYMYLFHLLLENEVHRQYEADKGGQMVPLQLQFEGKCLFLISLDTFLFYNLSQ